MCVKNMSSLGSVGDIQGMFMMVMPSFCSLLLNGSKEHCFFGE